MVDGVPLGLESVQQMMALVLPQLFQILRVVNALRIQQHVLVSSGSPQWGSAIDIPLFDPLLNGDPSVIIALSRNFCLPHCRDTIFSVSLRLLPTKLDYTNALKASASGHMRHDCADTRRKVPKASRPMIWGSPFLP